MRLVGICCSAVLVAIAAPGAAQTANLGIVKSNLSLCPSPCQGPGSNIFYGISAGNSGPDPAVSVTLSDPLPANTTFVELQGPAGWTCTTPAVGTTGTVTCTISSLGSGASTSLQLAVNVNASTPGGSIISNTATITSTTTDPNPGNNADTNLTQLVTLPSQPVPMLDSRALAIFVSGLACVGVLMLRRR